MFPQVEFNFLPVGHTHEDVDQLFSRIAEKLRHNDVYTLDGNYFSPLNIKQQNKKLGTIDFVVVSHPDIFPTFYRTSQGNHQLLHTPN